MQSEDKTAVLPQCYEWVEWESVSVCPWYDKVSGLVWFGW